VIDASVDTSATAPVACRRGWRRQDKTLALAADSNDVGGIGGPAVASVMSDEAT
jgi:hypothetical protein